MEKYILVHNPDEVVFQWEVYAVTAVGFNTKTNSTTYTFELIDGFAHLDDGSDFVANIKANPSGL